MKGRNFEDTLRDRLREAISPELPDEGAGDAIMRAVHRRASGEVGRRPAIRRLTALAGAVAVFLLFAGLLGMAFLVGHQANPVTPAPARPGPVVTAPVVPVCAPSSAGTACPTMRSPSPTAAGAPSSLIDLTWISDQVGWALAQARCPAGFCAQVFSTTDGGLTWQQLPDPPATAPPGCQPATCAQSGQSLVPPVSHIRFATDNVGYLWGPVLLMTTDAGRTWQYQQSPVVEALEASAGSVYRVQYDHGGCPGPCDRTVWRSAVGASSWHQVDSLPPPPSRGERAGLSVVAGQTVYVSVFGSLAAGAGTQEAVTYRSLDGGATWATVSDPCLSNGTGGINVAVDVAAAPNGFVSALCAPRSSGSPTRFVVTSRDEGSSWGPPHPVPGSYPQLITAADSNHLAVATGLVGGSGTITYELDASTDGGIHWSVAITDRETVTTAAPPTAFLGFQSVMTGRWVQTGNAIWTTSDGGAHWVRRGFPG